jgi:hypothetical protein
MKWWRRARHRARADHTRDHDSSGRPARKPAWFELEGAWIDFTVVPLAELSAALDGNDLLVTTTSRAPTLRRIHPACRRLRAAASTREEPPVLTRTAWERPPTNPRECWTYRCARAMRLNGVRSGFAPCARAHPWPWPSKHTGACVGVASTRPPSSGPAAPGHASPARCGEVEKNALFMHPPWHGGVVTATWCSIPSNCPPHLRPYSAPTWVRRRQ